MEWFITRKRLTDFKAHAVIIGLPKEARRRPPGAEAMNEADHDETDRDAPVVELAAAELRGAARSSLMFRTAKILCESGEYICVVRDVSATGARLRLFHAAPPDEHLFLELANGDRYAMERVWARDDHAGFRFSCVIDIDRFIAEPNRYPRRPIRLNLQRPADIIVDGVAVPAMLLDLSQQGARVEAGRKLALEQKLWLAVEGLPERFGCVRWRSGYAHGIVLQQGLALDELARFALALQPFGSGDLAPAAAARFACWGRGRGRGRGLGGRSHARIRPQRFSQRVSQFLNVRILSFPVGALRTGGIRNSGAR
jgi:hypothetical protein